MTATETAQAIADTRLWLERAVIGLDLCPFARAPFVTGRVRFAVCPTDDPRPLLEALVAEMQALIAADPAEIETTLLIHPRALLDFEDYLDFLDAAEAALEELGLDGVLQIASFHPDYRFEGADPDDPSHATNRSPHPMLQLLREASVERAVAAFGDPAAIYEANIETLRTLGADGWARLATAWRRPG